MTLYGLSASSDALFVFYNEINGIKGSHFEVIVKNCSVDWATVYNDTHLDRRYAHETKTASLIQVYFIIFQDLGILFNFKACNH